MKPILKKNEEDTERVVFSIETIQNRVIELIRKPITTVSDLERYFASWWCRHYNKPYKCEEVKNYSLEELVYEFYDVQYRNNPSALEERLNNDNAEDEDWLKKMMGEKYATKKEQEEKLEDKRDILDAVHAAAEETGDFKHTF